MLQPGGQTPTCIATITVQLHRNRSSSAKNNSSAIRDAPIPEKRPIPILIFFRGPMQRLGLVTFDSKTCKAVFSLPYLTKPRTTVSQDVQTRFPVQLAFAKFLSKIKEISEGVLYP